jgi:hypothetical protein
LPSGVVRAHSCATLTDASLLTPNQRRRLGRMIQMALIAARRSHPPDMGKRLAVSLGSGMGSLEDAGAFLENLISKEEREPMPARFPNSVHNAAAAQVAIDQSAQGPNSAPTAGEITFETALWQARSFLATGEVDCALAGAVDELDKYLLSIGQRWRAWTEQTRPGEGVTVASLVPSGASTDRLAQVTSVRLGRYRRPFDAQREADWIAAAVDLAKVSLVVSGAGGYPKLDAFYESVVSALSDRAGHNLLHRTYKQLCGEFHAASAFGFSVAVSLAKQEKCGVLLYTLSLRGSKAVCCIEP